MAEQQNRPPIKPTVFDVMSNWMFADPVAGATKRPNFRVKVLGNVPRLVVKTNVPDDKNNGRIDFNMDTATFAVIMNKLEELGKGGSESYNFEYNDDYLAGKKLDKQLTIATTKIGRDPQTGRVYIAVLGYERPKIQFFFGPSKYHAIKRGDGSELTEEELSNAYTLGFVKWVAPLVHNLLVSEFNPDAKNVAKAPTAPGQGGGGGYQRQQPKAPSGDFGSDFDGVEGFGDWT